MSDVPFEPLLDHVLLEPVPRGFTPGGVAIPEGADPDPPKCRVLKVGPGRYENGVFVEPTVEPGDLVYVMTTQLMTPVEFPHGGKKYIVARAGMLFGRASDPLRITQA